MPKQMVPGNMLEKPIPGVNFINILQAFFDNSLFPKKLKQKLLVQKTSRKMLVKQDQKIG